jgi:coenzyme F420-reducing hydrogenase delta subunit
MVFGCEHGSALETLTNASVAVVPLPCIAMLPPAFVDFLISRRHVEGVLLSGCRDGDCYYRLGIPWTRQRIAGKRDPYLRKRVPRERLATCWVGVDRTPALRAELEAFRARLHGLPSPRVETDPAARKEAEEPEETASHA